MILKLSSAFPSPKQMQRIVTELESGNIICYPTDTVYGIGCTIRNSDAIDLIFKLKNIPRKTKPLCLMFNSISNLSSYASVSTENYKILKKYLPGPFTFILPARNSIPKALFGQNRKTIGVRIPDNTICMKMVESVGSPIITTSMTDENGEIINNPYEIEFRYRAHLSLVIDGGELTSVPSTIIDLTGEIPEVIRRGQGYENWEM
ncbi:MAG: threonylcarbamoyl-AMP synthase [Candidatus Delongbacteria bacterium]|mgnify:CR=1 FL=1|nr:threonylcarbamoyl-AMP synthase [Candidatus Delongbacteria bacterium]